MSNPSDNIEIRLPTSAEAQDATTVNHLVTMINDIYWSVQSDLQKPDAPRTTAKDLAEFFQRNQMFLAVDTSCSGPEAIAGTLTLGLAPSSSAPPNGHSGGEAGRMASLGILTVQPAYRSTGLGRRLVDFAEATAKEAGCTAIKIDLLVPLPPRVNASKEVLKVWYKKLGYRYTRTVSPEELIPERAKNFIGDVEFWELVKPLA